MKLKKRASAIRWWFHVNWCWLRTRHRRRGPFTYSVPGRWRIEEVQCLECGHVLEVKGA